jgi:hypothetical protein
MDPPGVAYSEKPIIQKNQKKSIKMEFLDKISEMWFMNGMIQNDAVARTRAL